MGEERETRRGKRVVLWWRDTREGQGVGLGKGRETRVLGVLRARQ